MTVTTFTKRKALFAVISRASVLAILLSTASFFAPLKNAIADIGATHSALVSEFASFNAPGVVDGRVEAIAIDGDTVYVGGTFTQIQEPLDGEILDQPYLFAYSKSSGDIIRSFDPLLDNRVLALETIGDGSGVFAAGTFGRLNDEGGRRGLVKIDVNGDRVRGFGARPNKAVTTLVRLNNILYVGGSFDAISGIRIEHVAAVDVDTGEIDPDLNLDFEGPIPNPDSHSTQGVDDIDVTTDGRLLVIAGNFTGINGLSRTRLAVIELEGQAVVSDWNTELYATDCAAHRLFPQHIRGIDISPDNTYLVVGTTGHVIRDNAACDTITRLELTDLTNTNVQPTWANFATDSVYDVVATGHAVYTGGHFRLLNNSVSMNGAVQGPGAIVRLGMAALDPLNGLTLLKWRSDRNPRGRGTFALISEEEGLYIGDDTNFLNGTEHQKLKFLPVTENTIIRPVAHTLPATILTASGDALNSIAYDGVTLSSPTQVSATGWAESQGGMVIGGQLYRADSSGTLWVSPYPNGDIDLRTEANLRGLTTEQWQLSILGGMFFDDTFGRVYYAKQGDSLLYYRYFTPDGAFFGEKEYIAEGQGDIAWSSVSGMDVIDGYLYFGLTDGYLYRAEINGAEVVSGTTEMLSGPAIDGLDWNNRLLAFSSGSAEPPVTGEEFRFNSSGSDTEGRWQVFNFDVKAGEQITAEVNWTDPDSEVRIFLRDQSRTLVSKDIDGGSPATVSAVAESGGRWSIGVRIVSGATNYSVLVNTSSDFEPGADFKFNASGSQTEGAWQVFRFDVTAGEQVGVDVKWDDPMADVRLYLRDETNTQQDRNTVGIGSGALSALAATSGRWSVAVRIVSGNVNYTVSINTDAGSDADSDDVPDIFDMFPNDATETVDSDGDGTGDNSDLTPFGDNVQLSVVNAALGKRATQYTITDGRRASLAVDGNTSGLWSDGSVASTGSSRQSWWQVDLGSRINVGLVRIFNRTAAPERLSDFYVFVSDSDMSQRSISSLVDDPNVNNAFFSGAAYSIEDFNNVGTGRFVKIQLTGSNYLSLAEVEVYEAIFDTEADSDGDGVADIFDAFPNDPTLTIVDTDGDGIADNADATPFGDNVLLTDVNSALGKIATQSSIYPVGIASRAVDGNTSGIWSDNSVAHTRSDVQGWWQVDLGSSINIGLVRVYNRLVAPERLSDFHVFVSDTDMSGRSTFSLVNDPDVGSAFFSGAASRVEDFANVGTGRFVKVQLTGRNYLALAEVEVYEAIVDTGADTDGDGVVDNLDAFPNDPAETVDSDGDGIGDNADTTPFGDNVELSDVNSALGKIATQSTNYRTALASLAVDGNASGDWLDGSVTSTNRDAQAWWQVDLGNRINMGLIRIYNRTLCCPDRLSDFYVFVSDSDMSERSLSSLVNDPTVDNAFFSGQASDIEDIGSVGSGRFVKIQLTGNNYLSLAEVEVYEAILP